MGAIACWAAYIIPGLIGQMMDARRGIEPTWKGLSREQLAARDAERAQERAPARPEAGEGARSR